MVPKKIFSSNQIKDIVQRYGRNETTKEIGKAYGVCQSVITRVLKESGVKMRTSTFQTKEFTEDQKSAIIHSYRSGKSASEIVLEHGSSMRKVSGLLREAGFDLRKTRNERRRKLGDAQKREIAEKYISGKNQVEIAEEYSVSPPSIVVALKEMNVNLRTTSEAMGGLSKEKKEDVARLYQEGYNTVEIGRMFGVENSTIGRYLKELGVGRRSVAEVYGGFSREQEEEVVAKYISGMTSVEIAREYDKDYKSVLRLIEKRGLQKRTTGESVRLKTERELDVEQVCNRYKRGESSISIGKDCDLTYATIIRILEDNGIEIRDRGTLGDSVAHALSKTGNFAAEREAEYYVYTLRGYSEFLKPGITFDEATRKKSSGGVYDKKLLSILYASRTEAYFLEQAVLKETARFWDAPDELMRSGWSGSYELRRISFSLLEQVVTFYQERLSEIGIWQFAADYVPMTKTEREECVRRVESF